MHSHGKVTDPQHFEHSVGKLLYPNSRLGLANLTFVLTCFATAHLIFNPWAPFYGILQKTSLLRSIEVGTFLLTLFISVSWARNETDKIAKQFIWIVALVVAILTSITVPALVTFSFANEQVSFEDTVLDVNRSAGRTIASLKLESDKDVTLHPNRSTVRKFNKGAVVKIRGYRSARFGTYVTEVVGKE